MSVQTTREEGILTITIDRPEALNAVDPETVVRLAEAWTEFAKDDSLRVAILTGAGTAAFCTGADLARLVPLLTGSRSAEDEWDRRLLADPSVMEAAMLRSFPLYKPVISAVNGFCIAGGMELMQATDIRIASATATFGIQEAKWGLFPGGGSTVRLARQVPYAIAMEIMLTGNRMPAGEAWRIGLVNRVVPPEKLMETAQATARTIAANGPISVRKIKEAVLTTWGRPLGEALEIESRAFAEVLASEDAKEGPKAFQEKRKPRFQGR